MCPLSEAGDSAFGCPPAVPLGAAYGTDQQLYGQGRGTGSVPTAAGAEEGSPEANNCDLGFCPELSLAPFRGSRRVYGLLGKFGQAVVPLWASTGSI